MIICLNIYSIYKLVGSGHNYIGSEHLLLGLLREGEGVAARVLENLGADPSNIRTQASSRSHMLPLGSLILCFCGKLDFLVSS